MSGESQSTESLVEPLTRREREVLALLAEGLTSPEIAGQLTLAVSTVKSHIQQVYGKLGVNGKRQAVKRARELGLLKSDSHVAQIVASPPSAEPPGPKHNLPVQLTRFFGRKVEIDQIKERLDEHRLVTLTGSGGVGKTRLALRVAEEALDYFQDGVWLVELAPLSNPLRVPQQVASSLGLRDEPGRPVLDSLTKFLRARQVLLVLDNCEHLLEACAELADSWLRACPRLRLLACSREPLGVAGEVVFHVPSLPFPDPDHLPSIESLNDYDALSLFIDRARLVLPDYRVTAQNAIALARICQRLDGIPLALEMAAARLRLLDTETLADRLDNAFGLLTGGSRTALPRQQTLRATIDWSCQLLSEEERLLLQRLSVFAGGCTLEAAEGVCADPSRGEGLEAGQVLDWLAGLVDKSMVIADRRQGEETRYWLLEMVRQYAREKLQTAGESGRLQTRHRDYFLALAETTWNKSPTREGERRLQAEQENVRVALEWSFSEHGDLSDVEAGPKLLGFFMSSDGRLGPQEALDWCNRAVVWCQSHAGVSDLVYAGLLGFRAGALADLDLPSGVAGLKEAVEFSRRLGSEGTTILMWQLSGLGAHLASLDEIEQARATYAEAEAIVHQLGPDHFLPFEYLWLRGSFVTAKARLAVKQGQYADAKMYADESIRLNEENGQPWETFGGHLEIGHACLELGEYDQARSHFLVALNVVTVGNVTGQAYAKRCLGMAELGQGNLDRALEYCQASVRDANRALATSYIATGLGLAAMIAAKQSQTLRAATLSGASQARYALSNRKPWEDSSLDTILPGWREGPEQPAILQAFEAGQKMSVEQAVAYVLESATDE